MKEPIRQDKYIYQLPLHEQNIFGEHMDLLCRKGRCPYEWVDGIEMLDADSIPPPEAFRLQLSMIASYTIMMMMLINTKTHQAAQRHDLL